MRIVVVSAHFPPNFVSGGTLQPQRIAKSLQVRGHDVSVYAGWLGEDRVAGSSWQETVDGLPVRWIATRPWIEWEARDNFDNPVVARDFATFLDGARPDVVHVHALQSLGAPLLAVAKKKGAAVVVTMHDMWWCCARQFLVNRDLQPCCLVVAAGACACSVDADWLRERNAFLRRQLVHADLVLAPSAAAAEVLRANGIGDDRIVVDENGLPRSAPAAATPHTRAPGQPVRFLYAGGSSELKGVRVLFDALDQLGDTTGWHLDAYGVDEWLTTNRRATHNGAVTVHPPFPPDGSTAVFAAADVLVMPSIARESYSLLTREALGHGLPVIATDCVGPEEVVDDGTNGLIVASADASALARALRRVIDDRAELQRLVDHTEAVTVRTLDAQVAELERRYRTLGRSSTTSSGPTGPIRHVLFIAGIEGSPLRYRVRLPAEGLRLHGVTSEVRWYSDPALARAVRRADAVVVYRVPATKWMLDVVAEARRRGTPVLFDADDLIFDPDIACDLPAVAAMAPSVRTQYLDGVHRYRTMLEACDAFVASTPMLARHTHELTGLPVHRFDNGVGLVLGRLADVELQRPRKGGRVRVGYFSGTDTHDHDWRMIEGRVGQVLEQNPNVDLLLVGYLPDSPELERFGRRVQRLPFQPWDTLPAALRDLDVNLAPLTDDRFNVAKSAVKWLEAALVETPTVASPTEPFRDAIDDGRTGRLAATGDEWVDAINQLVRSEDDRVRMGQRARRAALLRWSPHLQGRRYLDLLEGTKAVTRTTAWAPVVVEEPRRARAVEPYLEVDAPPTTGERWRALTDRGRAFVARHGVGGAIARAPARAWRAVSARAKGRG